MITVRINQLKLRADEEQKQLQNKIIKKLHINEQDLLSYKIVRKSIDARKKPEIFWVYSVEAQIEFPKNKFINNKKFKDIQIIENSKQYNFVPEGIHIMKHPPVICGFGPAGMFCGYMLAKEGYKPIIIERGMDVESRIQKIQEFWELGKLYPNTNVQFGEGGAGTFSDGKLNTSVNDKYMRNPLVLNTLVEFGAPEDILYDAKPHIGTDILCNVVKNMREYIIRKGGQVLFEHQLTGIKYDNNGVTGITVNNNKELDCNVLVLAIGHSARDTFELLNDMKFNIEPKPFAIGVRVEHLQKDIDDAMYGKDCKFELPASPYKLTAKATDGRGVYSFCMCPGGYVVNASSEEGMLVVNGMSYSKRDGDNANSAIVTTISPKDYPDKSALGGMYLQRDIERKAFIECSGRVPVQRYEDFKNNNISTKFGRVFPNIKGQYGFGNVKKILPDYICKAIEECMPIFAKSIKGFDDGDVLISAVESRTSSPIRIIRDDNLESTSLKGVYPCGEGAGYAGGITSAAIDGVKVYEAIASKYKCI